MEAGVYIGSDYSLIKGIGQDYPMVVNLYGGMLMTDRITIFGELTSSPSWLTRFSSYMELGVGGRITLFRQERISVSSFGMIVGGLGSYRDYYESESTFTPFISVGLTPDLEILENIRLSSRIGYYHSINQTRTNSGLRFGLGLRYFF